LNSAWDLPTKLYDLTRHITQVMGQYDIYTIMET